MSLSLVVPGIPASRVRAQVEQAKPTATGAQKEKEAAEQKELEKKQLAMLSDLAASAWGLKLPENRLLILSGAADLLWDFDEKRARTLYWDALNALNLIAPPPPSTGKPLSKEEKGKLVQIYYSTFELRQKLVRQVAKKDAQLALDMLRASRQVPPQPISPNMQFPGELELEQGIASEIAARDPAQALQIARQTLAKGVTLELLNSLHRLNQKDPEKATQFAGEIITKLNTINVANDTHAAFVAIHLLQAARKPDDKQEARLVGVEGPAALSLSDEQKRDLVEVLTDAILSASTKGPVLLHLREVMPEIEHYLPERAAAVAKKIAEFKQRDFGEVQGGVKAGLPLPTTPEEMLRIDGYGDNATPINWYQQAAIMSVEQGKTDWFREAINKKPLNDQERAQVIDLLDAHEIRVLVSRKEIDKIQRLLPKVRRPGERARAMTAVSLMLKEKGEDQEAVGMLDDAAALIKDDLRDPVQTDLLLTLLCAYAVVDPPKAFAIAERTVDRANTQVSLLFLVDRVMKTGAVKKGEVLLEQPGLLPLDVMLMQYGKGVNALAKADFGRTKALAERFERSELRLMAQLIILKAMLQPESPSGIRGSIIRM